MARNSSSTDATKPEPTPAAQSSKPTGTIMYVGPSLVEDGTPFSHGHIFNNGLPAAWEAKALIEPEFRHLLVPVAKVGKAIAELKDPQSRLSSVSRAVLEASRKRIKEGAK
ncbi:MAG: hypothetical protein LUE17_06020 [Planctomycetaceae bacterium]|nr:hypothetical protein [Planctomycetaceae bacterium]